MRLNLLFLFFKLSTPLGKTYCCVSGKTVEVMNRCEFNEKVHSHQNQEKTE